MQAKPISQTEMNKISKQVRKVMPTPAGDIWEDPYEFINMLISIINGLNLQVNESDVDRIKSLCQNRRNDVYCEVETLFSYIEFTNPSGRVGWVNLNLYNDPGNSHNYKYECSFYF